MNYRELIENMTPQVYQSLKRAVELGKWPDGRPLTASQRQEALQAVIAWGERHLPRAERVGYIDKGQKSAERCLEPDETPLKWQ